MKMKLFGTSVILAALQCCAHGSAATAAAEKHSLFRPLRVHFDDLVEVANSNYAKAPSASSNALLEQLKDVGMISITGMPESFRRAKQDTLAWSHACAMESSLTKDHVFPDGTRRHTMATHTIPGNMDEEHSSGILQAMNHGDASQGTAACRSFNGASLEFRQLVDRVTRAFAGHVAKLLNEDSAAVQPLLLTKDGVEFKTLKDVVDNGEHLEHFHAYQVSSSSFSEETGDKIDSTSSTIEWHVDQGLFLVFTPGLMVIYDDETTKGQVLGETEGFYIELQDGTRAQVRLDTDDDLVVLLGDGINLVNPNGSQLSRLRAVPHAFSMPQQAQSTNQARVWYGRMVLAPASAIHPAHGETFGYLRQTLIDASITTGSGQEAILSMGCSSPSMYARQLETASCEEGTLLCWHRCMSLDEAGVSDEICAAKGLDLRCINPRMQLWDNTHGDFFPGCINASSAEIATEFSKVPDYPRDEDTCSDPAYESFVETKAAAYEHMANLTNGGVFMWSVEGDKINGMLAYNGLFGFTAFGFAGPGFPEIHPMYGGIIIMATPSSMYSPVTGFNMTLAPTVQEYIIDSKEFSFRFWMTPVSSTARAATVSMVDSYDIEETECFTVMTFSTPGIFNTTFNVSGTDTMMWAANGEDIYAGYHGSSRGVINVDWSAGKVTPLVFKKDEESDHDDHDNHTEHSHGDVSAAFVPFPYKHWIFGIVGTLMNLVWF